MSQYYFRVLDHETGFEDEIGQSCTNTSDAIALAKTMARELALDDGYGRGFTVVAFDHRGNELARAPSILLASFKQHMASFPMMTHAPDGRLH